MTVADILSLPGWTVHEVSETEKHLIIEASVETLPEKCPLCGSTKPPHRFGYRLRTLFDLPIRMKPVQLIAHRRRYRCRDCTKTFLDELPGIHPQHDATERLVEYIQSHALSMTGTFTGLAESMGVCEWFIRDVFAAHAEQLAASYVIQTPRYMGIDEIYVEDNIYCVITDIERRCVIDLLPKRDLETVKRWLAQLQCPEMVEAVTQDLWNPYRLAIREKLPHACIIADKYHVLRMVNDVVETVRKSLRASLKPAQAKQLKQDRKILLKRERDLTAHQRMILESWTGFVPVLSDLYRLKEEFFSIYDAGCEQDAYERYLAWEQHIPPSLSEAFLSLQLTVEDWGDEVFGYFRVDDPLTNAFTERANLAIRESTRITFGLSYQTLRAKLLFSPANTARLKATPQRFQPEGLTVG